MVTPNLLMLRLLKAYVLCDFTETSSLLYTVYEYVYLQVQAIPHDYARLVTERLLTPAHLPQPVQHRRALGYELSHAFPYILGCQGSRYQPCPKVFDCRCACA